MFLGPAFGPWMPSHLAGAQLLLACFGTAAGTGLSSHFVYPAGVVTLAGGLLHLRQSQRRAAAQHRQELALREELRAYLLFNGSPRTMPISEFACQVSHLVATRSSFHRAALLLRDGSGTLTITGSTGFDDLSVEAVNRWGSSVSCPDGSMTDRSMTHIASYRVGASSFTLRLDRRHAEQSPLSSMSCREVHIVPLRAGGLLGALVVCSLPRPASLPASMSPSLADLLEPLEALAHRVALQLTVPENLAASRSARSPSRPHSRVARQPAEPSLRTAR